MKKQLLAGVLAVAMAAVMVGIGSTGVSAEPASRTFSIAVHFEYADGFNYDYVLARGVEPSDVHSMLQECGKSHWTKSVVRYYCFAIPE
jgi:hypothetical protein